MRILACALLAIAMAAVVPAQMAQPIMPVSYSWTLPPPPSQWVDYRDDTCHITLVSSVAVTANVVLYYFPKPFGSATGASGLLSHEVFNAGVSKTVNRTIPHHFACPCLVCVTQQCTQGGNTHTQCGYVLRPGETLPPGWWTPFMDMGKGIICPRPPNGIFSDGFESGSIRNWAKRK